MIEKISLEVNIPRQSSVICDATLKFEITGTIDVIKNLERVITAELEKEAK